MKKGRAAVFSALLFLALLLPGFPVSAAEEAPEPVAFEAEPVFGELGRRGSHIPVSVRITGQTAAPFHGTVCAGTLESTDGGASEVYRYEYPMSVNLSETKAFTICVPLGQESSGLAVSLADETGKTVFRKRFSFETGQGAARLLIGVLSDDAERLDYFDDINLDYGLVRSKLLELNPDILPADSRGLELFDILLISDFDTESLSGEQREAIREWNRDGGFLLFGTGDHADRTLTGLAEDFVSLPAGPAREETIGMGTEYSHDAPGDSDVRTPCLRLSVRGGRDVLVSDGVPLFTVAENGRGRIGFFSFNPGELDNFCAENPMYPVRLLGDIYGEQEISDFYFSSAYGRDDEYWNAQSLVNTGNAERLPNMSLYAAVITVYILLAGPGSYLILKRLELGRFYGRTVVCLSAAGMVAVYLIGMETRFTKEFYTGASVCDIGADSVRETTYLNVRTPDSRSFSAGIDPAYEVRPLTRNQSFGEPQPVQEFAEDDWSVGLRFDGGGTVLSGKRSRAFEPRYFRLTRQAGENPWGEISSDLSLTDGKLYGYVTNGFPFALEDAAVILYGQALPIGDMKPGETVEFSGEPVLVWPPDLPNLLARRLTGEAKDGEGQSDSEYLRDSARTALYSFYIQEYYGIFRPEARLSAFGSAGEEHAAAEVSGRAVDGSTIYTQELELDTADEGMICRSGLACRPDITSGNGSFYGSGMMMYSSDPIAVRYYFGSDMTVEELEFLPVSAELLADPAYGYLRQFDGSAYFYNNDTGAYDEIDLMRGAFSAGELAPYLTAENSLLVRYAVPESGAAAAGTALPLPTVTGRER